MPARVATVDDTANLKIQQAIGNKEDTAVRTVGATNSILAYLKGLVGMSAGGTNLGGVGSVFTISKTLNSTAITSTGVDITGTSTGGTLLIDDIVLKTNATGITAGTNLLVTTNNANGQATILSTAQSGLGANKTVDLGNASVVKIKTILEAGKKLTVKSSDTDCTGTGTIEVTVKFIRLASGAAIAAA